MDYQIPLTPSTNAVFDNRFSSTQSERLPRAKGAHQHVAGLESSLTLHHKSVFMKAARPATYIPLSCPVSVPEEKGLLLKPGKWRRRRRRPAFFPAHFLVPLFCFPKRGKEVSEWNGRKNNAVRSSCTLKHNVTAVRGISAFAAHKTSSRKGTEDFPARAACYDLCEKNWIPPHSGTNLHTQDTVCVKPCVSQFYYRQHPVGKTNQCHVLH